MMDFDESASIAQRQLETAVSAKEKMTILQNFAEQLRLQKLHKRKMNDTAATPESPGVSHSSTIFENELVSLGHVFSNRNSTDVAQLNGPEHVSDSVISRMNDRKQTKYLLNPCAPAFNPKPKQSDSGDGIASSISPSVAPKNAFITTSFSSIHQRFSTKQKSQSAIGRTSDPVPTVEENSRYFDSVADSKHFASLPANGSTLLQNSGILAQRLQNYLTLDLDATEDVLKSTASVDPPVAYDLVDITGDNVTKECNISQPTQTGTLRRYSSEQLLRLAMSDASLMPPSSLPPEYFVTNKIWSPDLWYYDKYQTRKSPPTNRNQNSDRRPYGRTSRGSHSSRNTENEG